jgi:hypothetical protein
LARGPAVVASAGVCCFGEAADKIIGHLVASMVITFFTIDLIVTDW